MFEFVNEKIINGKKVVTLILTFDEDTSASIECSLDENITEEEMNAYGALMLTTFTGKII